MLETIIDATKKLKRKNLKERKYKNKAKMTKKFPENSRLTEERMQNNDKDGTVVGLFSFFLPVPGGQLFHKPSVIIKA